MDSSRRLDLATALLAFMMVALSSYLLFFDISLVRWNLDIVRQKQKIAEVVEHQNTVRVKSAALPLWEDIRGQAHQIYQKDSIFTDQNSRARLRFSDGSETTIGENALVIFDSSDESLSLDLKRGFIEGTIAGSKSDRKQAVEIRLAGKKTQISGENARIRVGVDEKGQASVTVKEGSARIQSPDGAIQTVKENQQGIIDREGRVSEIKDLKIKLLFPSASSRFYIKDSREIIFNWKLLEGKSELYELQISKDRDFRKLLYDKKLEASEIAVRFSSEGLFYWRVRGLQANQKQWYQSDFSSLRVIRLKAPQLIAPESGRRYIFVNEDLIKEVILGWKALPQVQSYHLQISKEPDFGSLLFEHKDLSSTSFVADSLNYGEYFWRVKANYSSSESGEWSEARDFQVRELPRPGAIRLSSPKAGDIKFIEDPTTKVSLKWKEERRASGYVIEFSQSKDFNEVLETFKVGKAGEVNWRPNRIGLIFWRVQAIDEFKRPTQPSAARSIHLLPKPPELFEPPARVIVYSDAKDPKYYSFPIEFKWGQSDYIKQVIFELSKDKNFENLVTSKNVKGRSFVIPALSDGAYYWRVRAQAPRSNKSVSSKPRKIFIEELPQLQAPKVKLRFRSSDNKKKPFFNPLRMIFDWIFPVAKAQEETIDIEWASVPGAREYVVEISSEDSFGDSLLSTKRAKAPELSWKIPKPGTYFFRVAIIDKFGRQSPFSDPQKLIRKPNPPTWSKPEDGRVFSDQEQKVFELSWIKPTNVDFVEIEISRNEEFEPSLLKRQFREKTSVRAKLFPNGDYFLRARSGMDDQTYSEYSPLQTFSVNVESKLADLEDDLSLELDEPEPSEEEEKIVFPVRRAYVEFGLRPYFSNSELVLKESGGNTSEKGFQWIPLAAQFRGGYQINENWGVHGKLNFESVDITPDGFNDGDLTYDYMALSAHASYRFLASGGNSLSATGNDANSSLVDFTYGLRSMLVPSLARKGSGDLEINTTLAHGLTLGADFLTPMTPLSSLNIEGDITYPVSAGDMNLSSPIFFRGSLKIYTLFKNSPLRLGVAGTLRYKKYDYDVDSSERGSVTSLESMLGVSLGYLF